MQEVEVKTIQESKLEVKPIQESKLEVKPIQESKINDIWNLYYHLPDDKQWDISSYKHILQGY